MALGLVALPEHRDETERHRCRLVDLAKTSMGHWPWTTVEQQHRHQPPSRRGQSKRDPHARHHPLSHHPHAELMDEGLLFLGKFFLCSLSADDTHEDSRLLGESWTCANLSVDHGNSRRTSNGVAGNPFALAQLDNVLRKCEWLIPNIHRRLCIWSINCLCTFAISRLGAW